MIRKYVFGDPFETDAVTVQIPAETKAFTEDYICLENAGEKAAAELDGFGWIPEGLDGAVLAGSAQTAGPAAVFTCELADSDRIYGLGENIRGINKRGWIYESNCTDVPNHTEEKRALYGAHNFLIVDGPGPAAASDGSGPAAASDSPGSAAASDGSALAAASDGPGPAAASNGPGAGKSGARRFGLFIDASQKVTFDCGYTDRRRLTITVSEGGFTLYILEGGGLRELVREFRSIIGRSYIPPRWAFGYGQSRWGYKCADDVREVVRAHREKGVPLDSVYMDIDYMESYKDFTVNEERFPDFPAFVEEMKEQHIHLVPIIDAGVKIEEGYPVYEEGVRNGYFCRNEDGTEFVGGVWPGRVHFPDMLNPKARKWFGEWYRVLLDAGIDGFWNDMNEPALFYSEKHLEEIFEKVRNFDTDRLNIGQLLTLQAQLMNLASRPEDYRTIWHDCGDRKVRHDHVHNLYGYNMTRAAAEAFERLSPEKRILLFSRSSYIGMHRYGGIWMGDNQSWWSHLLMNLQMLPSLNMCGFLYTGADLGGFGSNTTEDMMLRWLELGIFTPLMRNHSALGTRQQEFYQFGDDAGFRGIIGLRYALLPYLYSEFMKAALTGDMMFLPLAFVWPEDEAAVQVEDQLMVGESIMIAPVYRQNAAGRYVYLPEQMKMYRLRSADSMDAEVLPAGHHYVKAALNEVLIFVRENCLVPLAAPAEYADAVDASKLTLLHFIKNEAAYTMYDDDGISREAGLEGHLTEIRAAADGTIRVSGAAKPACRLMEL